MHGGADGSGAPKGPKNGNYKHGRCTAEVAATRRWLREATADTGRHSGHYRFRNHNPSAEANIALIYLGLGDHDQAMIWLNKGYEARFNPSILLRPAFDPLRSDAQFKDLLRRIGLPR